MLLVCLVNGSSAGELIHNGAFEAGNLSGWHSEGLLLSPLTDSGEFFVASGLTTPLESFDSVGAASGHYYAVSDSSGPGAFTLSQGFHVSTNPKSVILSFDLFVNDWNGAGVLNAGQSTLDGTVTDPTQYARVDLLTGAAGDFDLGPAIVQNFYLGNDGLSPSYGYTHYSFDITQALATGGSYQIRFATVNTQFPINAGVDNVSVVAAVPGPASAIPFGVGLSLVIKRARSAQRRAAAKTLC